MQSVHIHSESLKHSVCVPAEALKAMEKVASHINEMQKIYEDYGSVFDQLVAEQTGHDKEVDTYYRNICIIINHISEVSLTTIAIREQIGIFWDGGLKRQGFQRDPKRVFFNIRA